MIKKPNQITPLCTKGDPIHCVITSQTKYSEPLNLVVYYPSIATMMPYKWLHLKIVNYTQCNRNSLHHCALQCIICTKYENVKSVDNPLYVLNHTYHLAMH